MDQIKTEEHKELHKKIYDCECMPLKKPYCEECSKAVVAFMNKHGAGILTRDIQLEESRKRLQTAVKSITDLQLKLNKKSNSHEELREKVKSWGIILDTTEFDDCDAGLVRDEIKTYFHGKVTE